MESDEVAEKQKEEANDVRNFEITTVDCVKWLDRLERFTDKFEERGDVENARLMHLCAVLLQEFTLKVEAQSLNSIFPITGGEA